MTFEVPSKLMESPEFLATLFDAIPCGVMVVDEDRRIRAANRIFENAVGLERGEALGSCEATPSGASTPRNPPALVSPW